MDETITMEELGRLLVSAALASGSDGEGGQAPYSLAWYFQGLLPSDLGEGDGERNDLLAAYLGGNASCAVHAAEPDPELDAWVDSRLRDSFPQSAYPLNKSQARAVHAALANLLTVIIGPPGTGKTETILRILALAVERGETVAMVSSNHSAVDNVVEKVSAARLDGPAPATDLMARLAERLVRLGNASDREGATDASGTSFGFTTKPGKGKPKAHEDLAPGWEQHIGLDEFCRLADGSARCVTSTIHSLKKCFADGDEARYDLVVIDEASQASILMGIVAMSSARRIVVVGDDDQLPPVVAESYRADVERVLCASESDGPSEELLARVDGTAFDVANAQRPVSFLGSCLRVFCEGPEGDPSLRILLDEHYRCHPAIIGFCNEHVYGNGLTIGTRALPDAPAFPIGVRWYDADYREHDVRWEQPRKGEGHWRSSVLNERQLSILAREELPHIRELVEQGKSICFISPFWSQTEAVRELLVREVPGIAAALERGIDGSEDGPEGGDDLETALTVHRSQGKEFDCVYLLPVEDGKWEWPWSQGRRLVNVAVSRAKEELHVIVSTKLMYEEDQLALAGRVYKPDMEATDAEDVDNLFVCKLVHYVMGHRDEWSRPGQPDWCGMRKTEVRSVFDWSANLLGSLGKDGGAVAGSEETVVPETLVTCGLAHLRACDAAGGLAVARNVQLSCLSLGDERLDELASDRFDNPGLVHFDFVVVERDTRRVVALVEADGMQHRFQAYKDPRTGARRNAEEASRAAERDWEKERLVRELGGTCAWLGRPGGHQLVRAAGQECGQRFIPGHMLPGGEKAAGDESRLCGWAAAPTDLPTDSRFVFLRIPDDGSTAFEFDALLAGVDPAFAGPAHTVDEYVRGQLACGKGDTSLRLDDGVALLVAGEAGQGRLISELVEGMQPREANDLLVGMGILEDDASVGGRRPTVLGEFMGVSLDPQRPGEGFRRVRYDLVAARVVRTILENRSSNA